MSNSDKKLQDKLQQFSAPANPQAWEAMQAMLDKKDRPKFAFWWWTSGIAASAVIAVALLITLAAGKNDTRPMALSANQLTTLAPDNSNTSTNNTSSVGISQNKSGNNPASGISSLDESTVATTATSQADKVSNSASNTPAHNQPSEEDVLATPLKPSPKRKASRKNKGYRASSQRHTHKSPSAVYSNSAMPIASAAPQTAATSIPTTANTSAPSNEPIFIDHIASGLLSTNSLDSKLNQTEDGEKAFIKKPKKKLFSYSIGAQTMWLATFADKNLASAPSHNSGVMQWFGLGRYIAFNLGLTAGQTSFAGSDSFGSAYSLTTLSIPVGIQLNPIAKGRVTWIVNTGISNNFVLQQSVSLNNPPYQQQDGTNSTPNPTVNFGNLVDVKTMALEKSVNKYHLSFYAGTGIEVAIRRKVSFFSSATFAMPLTPVSSEKPKILQVGGVVGLRFRLL